MKVKEQTRCMKRQLTMWCNGDIRDLLEEGRIIQRRLKQCGRCQGQGKKKRRSFIFAKLMIEGKVKSALRLLSESLEAGPLCLNKND